jgi:hypothetical protein
VDTTVALSRSTGAVVDLGPTDSFRRRAYPDLDAVGLRAPLCSPAVRLETGGCGPFDLTRYARVTKAGPWILETTLRSYVVKRCGRRGDVLHLTISTAAADAVLGTDTLAYLDHERVKVENLSRGTSISLAWPSTTQPSIALAGRHLLMSTLQAGGSYAIYEAD